MATWFKVDAATDRVEGWQRSKGDIPADTQDTLFRDASGKLQEFNDKKTQLRENGQRPVIFWDNGNLTPAQDTRNIFRLDVDKGVAAVGDTVVMTLRKRQGGGIDTDFNGRRILESDNGELFLFDFTAGIAVKNWVPTASRQYIFRSDHNYLIVNGPVDIKVVV